ncbi:MAG TPA: LysM peptidoglycan-binding domain-containing protein [Tissierellaceae bacterium]|nr:LysM peptidoglycan-binding domain-containing protein [Tissierellaceae bacterium]
MKDYNEMSRSCPRGSFSYTIKAGDTLYQLARTYNTSVEAILAINPGINPNNLQIGQRICIPDGSAPPRCPAGSFAYTIRQGDTLWQLARTYNTTVEAIMALNPGIDPNNLQIGQVICIPDKEPRPRCPVGSFAYTIRQGDTLWQLARTYNTTVEAIMALNPGIDPNNLQIGQVICIPRSKPTCDGLYYVVRAGDTLYSIAMRYDVTVASLIEANPGIDPNNLQIGQVICIPKGEKPKPCPGGTLYVVRENDSLSTILLRFNISVMDLLAGNPNLDIDRIKVGQELCILPHKDRGCPCRMGTKPYTIKKSDIPSHGSVVAELAMKFDTTVSYLMQANPNMAPGDFVEGAVICVPH